MLKETPRIMVIGHKRHGKDSACEFLRNRYGLTYTSSSEFACRQVVYPLLAPTQGYQNPQECFADRDRHRAFWYQAIWDYNRQDPTRLAREIFARYNVYCGMRHYDEFTAVRAAGLVDLVVWVDASDRLPPESTDSFSIPIDAADVVIRNNGHESLFYERLSNLFDTILKPI